MVIVETFHLTDVSVLGENVRCDVHPTLSIQESEDLELWMVVVETSHLIDVSLLGENVWCDVHPSSLTLETSPRSASTESYAHCCAVLKFTTAASAVTAATCGGRG